MAQLKTEVSKILDVLSPEIAIEFNRRFAHPQRNSGSESLAVSDLNTFWRIELAKLEQDTITAREALIDNVSGTEWLELFENYVAPTVVLHWPGVADE